MPNFDFSLFSNMKKDGRRKIVIYIIDISSISETMILTVSKASSLLLVFAGKRTLVSLALSARITWQWRDLGTARALRMNELIILRRDRRQLRPERHNLNESGRADCNIDRNYAKSGTTTSPSAVARRSANANPINIQRPVDDGKGFHAVYRTPGRLLTFTWAREYIKRAIRRDTRFL